MLLPSTVELVADKTYVLFLKRGDAEYYLIDQCDGVLEASDEYLLFVGEQDGKKANLSHDEMTEKISSLAESKNDGVELSRPTRAEQSTSK